MDFIKLNLIDYSNLKNHILTDDEIRNYINRFLEYGQLSDSIKNIVIDEENICDLSTFAYYDNVIESIVINKSIIINKCNDIHNDIMCNLNLLINTTFITSINHELVHIIQDNMDCNNELIYQFKKEFKYTYINKDEYEKYYGYFTYERDAITLSLENSIKLLKIYYPNEFDIILYFLKELKESILLGYELINDNLSYPNNFVNTVLLNGDDCVLTTNDPYINLKLGFNVDKEEYINFKNTSCINILKRIQ